MAQQGWTPVPEDSSPWQPVPDGPIPASQQPPLPEGPSPLGFASNVVGSGLEFATNLGHTLMHPVDTVNAVYAAISQPTASAKAMKRALIERYGSIDAALNSAYTDPVGVASDLSILAGGAGMAAKGVGLAKAGRALSAASEVLNPLAIPAKATSEAGPMLYRAAISPSRRIQRGFPGAVDAGYDRNILPTQNGLERADTALEDAAGATQRLLAEADAAGAPGVNVKGQVVGSLKEPARKAGTRMALGKPDERPAISARAKALARMNPTPVPLTQANTLKQEAQRMADSAFRAAERGAIIKDLDALGDQRVAQALRKAIETNAARVGVTGVAKSNQQTQALIGLAQALEDATQQPSRLTNLISAATAGGAGVSGGPVAAAAAGLGVKAATSRTGMAVSGLMTGKIASPLLKNAQIVRALNFLQQLQEQAPEQ